MEPLERLDKILGEFEENAKAIDKIKLLIQEINNSSSTLNKNTELINTVLNEIVVASEKVETSEKSISKFIENENYTREEFLTSVKSILVKMNNENMDLYQNLSKSVKGSIETSKIEISNIINTINNETKQGFEKVENDISQTNNNLYDKVDALGMSIEGYIKDINIKLKNLKTMIVIALGGITINLIMIIVMFYMG